MIRKNKTNRLEIPINISLYILNRLYLTSLKLTTLARANISRSYLAANCRVATPKHSLNPITIHIPWFTKIKAQRRCFSIIDFLFVASTKSSNSLIFLTRIVTGMCPQRNDPRTRFSLLNWAETIIKSLARREAFDTSAI